MATANDIDATFVSVAVQPLAMGAASNFGSLDLAAVSVVSAVQALAMAQGASFGANDLDAAAPAVAIEVSAYDPSSGIVIPQPRRFFLMRARDLNTVPSTPPTYRTWTVLDNPDPTAEQYDGVFSGGAKNFELAQVSREGFNKD